MMGQHAKFIARTVFVQNNNVEEACRVINKYVPSLIFYINHIFICFSTIYGYPTYIFLSNYRIMGAEGWFDQYRRTRRYEKPFMVCSC